MKKFLKKSVIAIVAAAVALGLCLSVAVYVRGHSGSFVSDGSRAATGPFESGIASIAGWLEHIYGYMYKYDELESENESLRSQVSDLQQQLRDSGSASEENDRLRELLNLQQKHRDFVFEDARVVSWDASNWSSAFTIDKGRSSGIELYDSVVTEEGYLVGRVTELSDSSAVISTLIDPDTSIGAAVDRSGAAGVAEGDFELMTHGCCKLSYLPVGSELLTGDTILTSGSDVFPSGLVVGTVASVGSDKSGISDYAVVKPSADLYSLTQVFVIKDFDITD